jgi:hypothetical protein
MEGNKYVYKKIGIFYVPLPVILHVLLVKSEERSMLKYFDSGIMYLY